MKLSELLKDMPYLLDTQGDMDTEIGTVTCNSREAADHGLFFCIAGTRFDSHDFAPQAVENGCTALVVEHYLPELPVPQVRVSNARGAVSRMAAAFYGHPGASASAGGYYGNQRQNDHQLYAQGHLRAGGLQVWPDRYHGQHDRRPPAEERADHP